jgi:hypothetical protein
MQYQKLYTLLYFVMLLLLLPGIKAKAQNVTSPYSILGIGDIDTKDYGRYFGSGSTSIARRDQFGYNFSNPASLTALPYKMMNFDVAMRGRVSIFQTPGTDTFSSASKDYAIKRITMAFKVSPTVGIAFGLRPYSSVNYAYIITEPIFTGSTSLIKSVDGSGGVNQVYFAIGKMLGKHPDSSKVSIGLTASYLFGSMQKTTDYTSTDIGFSFTKLDITTLYGSNWQAGIQYDSYSDVEKAKIHPLKKWEHRLGLTATISTPLNGQITSDFNDNSNPKDTIVPETVTSTSFKLPTSIGFGYSATHNNKLTLSFDVNYSKWPNQNVDYPNSYTTSTLRISAGLEYSYKIRVQGYEVEKYYLAMGVSGENSYIMLNNNYLKDYSGSIGAGCNLSQKLSIYGGVEEGVRGSLGDGQIKEIYTSFLLGVTLKDLWYGTRKFGKYY